MKKLILFSILLLSCTFANAQLLIIEQMNSVNGLRTLWTHRGGVSFTKQFLPMRNLNPVWYRHAGEIWVDSTFGYLWYNNYSVDLRIADTAWVQGKLNSLPGFTEVDPTVPSYVKSISNTNINNWNSAFSWGNHALAGYLTTEIDPTVPGVAKALTGGDTSNWNTSYRWGNHAGLYKPITYVPAWTEITGKPSFAGVALSGDYNDLINKPAIPTVPTNVSAFTNDVGYLTSIPNQTWASITGKPTTLSGYGITDAYPLSGNPSGFITSASLTWANISGKPSFATVATSGNYNDLTGKPTIPVIDSVYSLATRSWTIANFFNKTQSDNRYMAKNDTFPTGAIMTSNGATNAINGLSNQINGRVPQSRNLTINGTTFNLSADRTWTLTTSDIPEGSNLYFTNARARSAISLTTTGTSGAATYNSSTGVLNIPQYTGTTYTAGTGINIAGGVITNTAPDQTVSLTAGRGIAITGTYPNFTISLVTPTITVRNTANGNARALNSNFTVDANKEAIVTYTVTCSVTNPLLVGTSSATAFLEYSTNGGSTWNLPSQAGNSSGVGVTVTLQLTNGQTGTLIGVIPQNALTRIRTATSGTATVTYVTGQETVY